jgi:beta-lactamase class A
MFSFASHFSALPRKLCICFLCSSLSLLALAEANHYYGPGDLPPLADAQLQKQLALALSDQSMQKLIRSDRLGVALVVIDDEDNGRLAMINGNSMLYAASLPKIAILLGAMVASENGELEIDAALEQDLHKMIRKSSNSSATRVLKRVGRQRLLEILQSPEYGFYDDDHYGGLWVGKDYAGAAAFERDPLHGLSHGATVYQVARFYFRLKTGTLVDAEHTRLMYQVMSEPGINHKFMKVLNETDAIQVLRKSGSWKNFHADSAMVGGPGYRYIMVALVEDANGEQLLQHIARRLHRLATPTIPHRSGIL